MAMPSLSNIAATSCAGAPFDAERYDPRPPVGCHPRQGRIPYAFSSESSPRRSCVSSTSCLLTLAKSQFFEILDQPRRNLSLPRCSAFPPRTSTEARSTSSSPKLTVLIMSPPPRNGGIASSRAPPPVKYAHARRPKHLVAGEGHEVAADLLYVHGMCGTDCAASSMYYCSRLVRELGHLLRIVYRAEHVGDVRERD